MSAHRGDVDDASSRKRARRPSNPGTPTDSPGAETSLKRHATAGGAQDAEAAADPPVVVTVEPPENGHWCLALQTPRDAGEMIDIVLLAGDRKILAHKVVLIALSPYLHGLLTSGLAESVQGDREVTIGDDTTDGRAVEAIVDCFYTGTLSLSSSSVSDIICTSNLLQVSAVEKAACDFFVGRLEPSNACKALAFATAHAECGQHARGLLDRCIGYVAGSFVHCSSDGSFLDLPPEVVAAVLRSDALHATEDRVVTAVREWFGRDMDSRLSSLRDLVPLIRWPLLPAKARLQLSQELLLVRMMRLDDEARSIGIQLLTECSREFADSDAAATCPRLKRRGAAETTLAFTRMSEEYTTSENGALLRSAAGASDCVAMCRDRVMATGRSCAEFVVVKTEDCDMMIGVARPTLGVHQTSPWHGGQFWGYFGGNGALFSSVGYNTDWVGDDYDSDASYGPGDVLRLLLDSDAGSLTVKKNGGLVGTMVTGLAGELCWAACCTSSCAIRIRSLDPDDF